MSKDELPPFVTLAAISDGQLEDHRYGTGSLSPYCTLSLEESLLALEAPDTCYLRNGGQNYHPAPTCWNLVIVEFPLTSLEVRGRTLLLSGLELVVTAVRRDIPVVAVFDYRKDSLRYQYSDQELVDAFWFLRRMSCEEALGFKLYGDWQCAWNYAHNLRTQRLEAEEERKKRSRRRSPEK